MYSQGPLLTPYTEPPSGGDPFPHSMDPQFRALGLASTLIRGVPSLNNPHTLCRKGEKLSSEKCRILKLLGLQMAVSVSIAVLQLTCRTSEYNSDPVGLEVMVSQRGRIFRKRRQPDRRTV